MLTFLSLFKSHFIISNLWHWAKGCADDNDWNIQTDLISFVNYDFKYTKN